MSVSDVDVCQQVLRTRKRSGLRFDNSLLDEFGDLLVDLLKLGARDDTGFAQASLKDLDTILVGADILQLSLAAIRLRIPFEMTEKADHLAFEQRWPTTLSCAFDDLPCCFVDSEEISAIDGNAGHAKTGGAVDIRIGRHRPVDRCRFRITVVLDNEDRRQIPYRSKIQTFKESALVRGAVANEAESNTVMAELLRRERSTASERRAGAHDTVGAHHPLGQIGNVHGTPFAVAGACDLAIDFRH